MPHSIIPEDRRVKYVDSDASEYEWQYESYEDDAVRRVPPLFRQYLTVTSVRLGDRNTLAIPIPSMFLTPLLLPTLFPAVYPPEIEHEPFPRDWKASFPPPQWDRRPAKAPSKQPPVVEFEEFSEVFARMSVKERLRKRWRIKKSNGPQKCAKTKRTSPPPSEPDRSAATIFITTRPPAAPLTAFIRPTTASRRFLVPPLPTVPAPPSRKRVFESLDHTSIRATLVATPLLSTEELGSLKERSSSQRKVAPLPRRVPNVYQRRAPCNNPYGFKYLRVIRAKFTVPILILSLTLHLSHRSAYGCPPIQDPLARSRLPNLLRYRCPQIYPHACAIDG
jgi:hypothetical protein